MTKSTPPQATMAMPWVRGLLIRGTLMAREIPDRARIPSVCFLTVRQDTEGGALRGGEAAAKQNMYRNRLVGICKLTNSRHDLRLEAVLVLEAARKVADAALAVARDVRDLPDLVEHVAAGEEQDRDERDGRPHGAVLHHRQQVRPRDVRRRQPARRQRERRDPPHPVDRPLDRRVRPVGQVPRHPAVDLLGCLGSGWGVSAPSTTKGGCGALQAYPFVKS